MIEIGQKLNGRYKIIRSIGNGGMANVYLAHDLILNRNVAVKVLRFDFQDDQSAIRRFQREALAASELVHPNVVGVYDVGEENGMQYIVMEYVEGTDLKKYLNKNYPISQRHIVQMMEQILMAVSLAHQHRIIHRDLKPQNVLVDLDGNVKIADFGIAIALSETSITQTNTLLGSVHYLSPEQARGSMATRQSDIYALGIILYELLAGKVPFEGESAVSIALKHFQSEIPDLRQSDPNLPQSLINVVNHATAKEPSDRYTSADEMYQDIHTALDPERQFEPEFQPQSMIEQTRVLTPVEEQATQSVPPTAAFATPEAVDPAKGEDSSKKKGKKKKKKAKWILLLLFLCLIVGGIAYAYMSTPKTVTVPDVSGKTVTQAKALLAAKKLQTAAKVKTMASDAVAENRVIQTDPEAQTEVKENATITLYINKPDKITFSDYVGMQISDVKKTLVDQGFDADNITVKEEYSDSVAADEIISQSVDAGDKVVPAKQKVKFVVSKGPESVTIQDLRLLGQEEVKTYLQKNGLILVEAYDYSDTVSEGLAISQTPAAGTELTEGQTVTVTFSLGQKPESSSSSSSSESESSTTAETSSTTRDSSTSSSSSSSSSSSTSSESSTKEENPD